MEAANVRPMDYYAHGDSNATASSLASSRAAAPAAVAGTPAGRGGLGAVGLALGSDPKLMFRRRPSGSSIFNAEVAATGDRGLGDWSGAWPAACICSVRNRVASSVYEVVCAIEAIYSASADARQLEKRVPAPESFYL